MSKDNKTISKKVDDVINTLEEIEREYVSVNECWSLSVATSLLKDYKKKLK